jgi:beta-glucosidase
MRIPTTITALLAAALGAAAVHAAPPLDPAVEKRIDALIGEMTVDEKLGQLSQLATGATGPEFAPPDRLEEMARQGQVGSVLNLLGAEATNRLQRVAVEKSRLRIPILIGYDVIHGYRTVFPVPLAEASSFDPALAERNAAVAAREAASAGVHWTFAPKVDIARDPRWGRIVEGSGEDAFLGSAMAAARVRGFQGAKLGSPGHVVACAKHYVAYGAATGGRDYDAADISERTLREVYLPPFKAAVDAGTGTLMSAFNDLSGIPASANPFTLTQVLRKEWGFDGFVVSDWNSVIELVPHGLAAGPADAAREALSAGVDMEMVSRTYATEGGALLAKGALTTAQIDEAVRRVLRIKLRAGLFDHPYVDEGLERTELLSPANRQAALEAARESMVLLRNDGTLPLKKDVKALAVIGPLADSRKDMIGPWAGAGRGEDSTSILEGIRKLASPGTRVVHVKGCEIEGDDEAAAAAGIAEAVKAARDAGAAVLVVGESADMSGEAASRSSLDLPGHQEELARAVIGAGVPVAVVLVNGRPLAISWLAEHAPAILETWFLGTRAGDAVAEALFGDVNPSGKLPVTFPRSVGQVPIFYDHRRVGRPPTDQKFTSKYLDLPSTPLYPFGFGLSYTRFRYEDLKVSSEPGRHVRVSAELVNAGDRAGDEVVQLYVRDDAASVTRPTKQLRGFERVRLTPGERKRVEFVLGPEHLGFLGRDLQWTVEPGSFHVWIGPSSADGLEGTFEID